MTDYEVDVQRIERDIAEMLLAREQCVAGMTPDSASDARLFFRRFQLLSLTGEAESLAALDFAVQAAIAASSSAADLHLIRASIGLKRHRFNDVQKALQADTSLQASQLGMLLQSDVDFQRGKYSDARVAIEAAVEREPTWDALARLAYICGVFGDLGAADKWYSAAEDELTAKQMQTFAWLQLQRGSLNFQCGRYEEARRFYERAERGYSGYWLTRERMAELAAAQGHFAEAIAGYECLYALWPRAAWSHVLGDICTLSGDLAAAHAWQLKAYAAYVASVKRGEVYELHSLVDLCCELAGYAEEAVTWAREDVTLRSNYTTQGDLAWALYRRGEVPEALQWIEAALDSGAVSGRLFLQAACVYAAANQTERSRYYTERLRETNPVPARARVAASKMQIRRSAMVTLAI